MAGANFPRIKVWSSTEDVVYSDLNAEFDNILNNMSPEKFAGYSANVTQMQETEDPGEVGSENLATTLAGEITRLRSVIKEITGEDQWYESPVVSLVGLSNAIGTNGLTANRLVSGRMRSSVSALDSDQPIFLVPNGITRSAKVDGTPVNFRYYIAGIEYVIDSDVTISSLTAAPGANNTALVNAAHLADQDFTRYLGEDGSSIPIDTVGSNISAQIGKYAAFSINNGSETEMFIARVETNALVDAKRAYFFDSSDTPQERIAFSNNDVITLLKLTWVFAKSDGTLTFSNENPIWSFDEPTSPNTNDYWFDFDTAKWMKFDISNFIDAEATLIGVTCQNTTACIGARSSDFFKAWSDLNTIELYLDSNSAVRSRFPGAVINVWGNSYKNEYSFFTWDMGVDLDTGVTEDPDTFYFFYITEDGEVKISDVRPYDRREDLLGYYHPHNSWRCVGYAYNDGSSNLGSVESFFKHSRAEKILTPSDAAYSVSPVDEIIPLDSSGGPLSQFLPPAAQWRGQTKLFIKVSSDTNVITIEPFDTETIGGLSTRKISALNGFLTLFSDGVNIFVRASSIPEINRIRVEGANSYGSTNTVIRRFDVIVENTGTAITYADSASDGASFTINEPGVYAMHHTEGEGTYSGISLNSSELTTSILSISSADRIAIARGPGNTSVMVSATIRLQVGDVIRPHSSGSGGTIDVVGSFEITKIGE